MSYNTLREVSLSCFWRRSMNNDFAPPIPRQWPKQVKHLKAISLASSAFTCACALAANRKDKMKRLQAELANERPSTTQNCSNSRRSFLFSLLISAFSIFFRNRYILLSKS